MNPEDLLGHAGNSQGGVAEVVTRAASTVRCKAGRGLGSDSNESMVH